MIKKHKVMGRRQPYFFLGSKGIVVWLLLGLLMPLCFTSCGAKRGTIKARVERSATLNKQQFMQAYEAMTPAQEVEASGTIDLFDGQKEVGSRMRWSLERDRSFVLSIRPMGLMEVAKLSVVGDKIIVLDRMGRRGFESDDSGLLLQSIEGLTGYDPKVLRAVVQNEPFTLTEVGKQVLRRMDFRREGRFYHFSEERRRSGERIEHIFDAELNLIESRVVLPGQLELRVQNRSFVAQTTDPTFQSTPAEIDVSATVYEVGGTKQYQLSVKLGKVSDKISLERERTLPRGYRSLTVQEVIRLVKDL